MEGTSIAAFVGTRSSDASNSAHSLLRESWVKKRTSVCRGSKSHRASLDAPPSRFGASTMISRQQTHTPAHRAAHGIVAATAMANLGISTLRNGPGKPLNPFRRIGRFALKNTTETPCFGAAVGGVTQTNIQLHHRSLMLTGSHLGLPDRTAF